jgi:hypothetical protein
MVLLWLVQVLRHLKSLNVYHFVMIAATALKLWRRGHLQWQCLHTEFHKNLPFGSKVDRGTDIRKNRMVISLAYIFPLGRKVG